MPATNAATLSMVSRSPTMIRQRLLRNRTGRSSYDRLGHAHLDLVVDHSHPQLTHAYANVLSAAEVRGNRSVRDLVWVAKLDGKTCAYRNAACLSDR